MSTKATFLEQWRDLMRARGHTVLEAAGWRTRDAEPGRGYDPTRMFLEHHDASTVLSGNWGALGYVTANKLAQLVFSRDGQAMIVAAGITWHAGVGGPFADIPANQGNWYSLAVEVANSGSEPYGAKLTQLIIDAEACWCIVAERTADRVRGHKEWATPKGRKQDPSVDMNARRAQVAAAIANPSVGDDMPLTPADARTVWGKGINNGASAEARLAAVDRNAALAVSKLDRVLAGQAAMEAAVRALAGANGVDPADVLRVVEQGVDRALADLSITLSAAPDDTAPGA